MPEPDEYTYYTRGRCYRRFPTPLNFTAAMQNCIDLGGRLAYGRTNEQVEGYSIFWPEREEKGKKNHHKRWG